MSSDPASSLETVARPRDRRTTLDLADGLSRDLDALLKRIVGAGARGLSVLLHGPPGSVREGIAETVAAAARAPLLRADLRRIESRYIGETEKNLDALLEAAEAQNAVLLFDEADALFGKRTDVADAHDRYANQEVSYLLARTRRFDGIAILATNYRSTIDDAILREFATVLKHD